MQGFRGKLEILEKRRLDLDAARRDYNKLEQQRVKKSEGDREPPAELIIKIQAKEVTLNGNPFPPLFLPASLDQQSSPSHNLWWGSLHLFY